MKKALVLVLAVCIPACGTPTPEGGGDDTGPIVTPTLVSISILPLAATIDLGEHKAFTAYGSYSNGSSSPIGALWSIHSSVVSPNCLLVPEPAVVTMSSDSGTTIDIYGNAEGEATLKATVGVHSAEASITCEWAIPLDPGPIYFNDAGYYASDGFVTTPDGTKRYALVEYWNDATGAAAKELHEWTQGGGWGKVADWPAAPGGAPNDHMGLDIDSLGRVYTMSGFAVFRWDPATGNVAQMTPDGVGDGWSIGVAPDNTMYTTPLFSGAGGASILKYNPATGAFGAWGWSDPNVPDLSIAAGIDFNRRGEGFSGTFDYPAIVKHSDTNGNGSALDDGEQQTFAYIPGSAGNCYLNAIALTRGGGVLFSLYPSPDSSGSPAAGIYWAVDRDGDGVAMSAGEVTLYSSEYVIGARDFRGMQARR